MNEREAIVAWLRGDGGRIPALAAFAPLVSGNRMPDMSGDARNRLHGPQRRDFDNVVFSLCAAVERGDHLKGKSDER